MAGQVFISYAREDKSIALELYEMLDEQGFSVWLDEKNLLPGQDWKLEIENAIRESEIFLSCLSNRSVSKKGFVQVEQRRALEFAELLPEGQVYIIPVRLDDCKVPARLSGLQWVDYFEEGGKEKLFKAITYFLRPSNNVVIESEQFFDAGERLKIVRVEL